MIHDNANASENENKAETLGVLSLEDSEIRFRRLFEAAQDGILILDASTGMITDVNPFLMRMLGYSREELVKKKLWEVGAFRDIEASKEAFNILQMNEYIRYEDLPLKTKTGKLIQVEFVSNVYWVGKEKVIQCNIRDITERVQAQEALVKNEAFLREQSVRDHLTGLFNRRYMEETLEREMHRALRKKFSLGLMMVDIDNFKQINDTLGHAGGDAILRAVGNLLLAHVRSEDIACRYGGDEFVLILPESDLEVLLKRAELICENARQIHLPADARPLETVTLSIGLALSSDNSGGMETFLAVADKALYRAKNEGRDRAVAASC